MRDREKLYLSAIDVLRRRFFAFGMTHPVAAGIRNGNASTGVKTCAVQLQLICVFSPARNSETDSARRKGVRNNVKPWRNSRPS